jgi:hypothetical protein
MDNGKKCVKKNSLVGSKQARSKRFGWASKHIFLDLRIERLLGQTQSRLLILYVGSVVTINDRTLTDRSSACKRWPQPPEQGKKCWYSLILALVWVQPASGCSSYWVSCVMIGWLNPPLQKPERESPRD